MSRRVTKSDFLAGAQCLKRLYLLKHLHRLEVVVEPFSEIQQEILNAGTEVGLFARGYHPNGADCGGDIETTKRYLRMNVFPLYEAAFEAQGMAVSCDILTKASADSQDWSLYEVKSSTKVKESHILDAGIQYWTLSRSGLSLASVSLLHINGLYRREGTATPVDPRQLFSVSDITSLVLSNDEFLSQTVEDFHTTLEAESAPNIAIGPHCNKPHRCEFFRFCSSAAGLPPYSVLDLVNSRSQKWDLLARGLRHIRDIPHEALGKLGTLDRLQVMVEKEQKPYHNHAELRRFLSTVEYPIHFLDFESFSAAIPLYEHTAPYQAICFQWSLHSLALSPASSSPVTVTTARDVHPERDSSRLSLRHQEFLADGSQHRDPRLPFLLSLLAALSSSSGTILVYNLAFEATRLRELGEFYPEAHEEVQRLLARMVDLALPFRRRDFLTPEMKGRYSLKAVLPALVPSMAERYGELEISNGYLANIAYRKLMSETPPLSESERLATRENLLRYCELDTLAMVKILEEVQRVVSPDSST
jgi:hypothetical protein